MSVLSTSKVPQTWNESWWWVGFNKYWISNLNIYSNSSSPRDYGYLVNGLDSTMFWLFNGAKERVEFQFLGHFVNQESRFDFCYNTLSSLEFNVINIRTANVGKSWKTFISSFALRKLLKCPKISQTKDPLTHVPM